MWLWKNEFLTIQNFTKEKENMANSQNLGKVNNTN